MNYVKLKNRGLITISGPDRRDFLQNLITNDMNKLESDQLLYACLLTPQGKFLHDFFIRDDGDAFILDCEGADRAQDLHDRLAKYKLRQNVELSAELDTPVYASFEGEGYRDPRHSEMGVRLYSKPDGEEQPFDIWDTHRIKLTIPDGSRDLIPEKSTMDEAHMDQLNAIDYEKGCYVGQELTARMHYRGLGKKHLQTVDVNDMPDKAELRSHCGSRGIALVKTT